MYTYQTNVEITNNTGYWY